ncbi:hypothetical protein ACEPAF_1601 [Sanghuangporus sanghuang]
MDKYIKIFHRHKKVLSNARVRDEMQKRGEFYIPKIELLMHIAQAIRMLGASKLGIYGIVGDHFAAQLCMVFVACNKHSKERSEPLAYVHVLIPRDKFGKRCPPEWTCDTAVEEAEEFHINPFCDKITYQHVY